MAISHIRFHAAHDIIRRPMLLGLSRHPDICAQFLHTDVSTLLEAKGVRRLNVIPSHEGIVEDPPNWLEPLAKLPDGGKVLHMQALTLCPEERIEGRPEVLQEFRWRFIVDLADKQGSDDPK